MVLAWGKYYVFVNKLVNGKIQDGAWIQLPVPKEGTTAVNPTQGDKQEAKEEGGGIVDTRRSKSTFELVYDLFVKKGEQMPFEEYKVDGVIMGEYAVAVQPAEDPSVQGVYMGNTALSTAPGMSSTEGAYETYTHSARIPTGDDVAKVIIDGETHYRSVCWKVITATKGANGYSLTFADPAPASSGD